MTNINGFRALAGALVLSTILMGCSHVTPSHPDLIPVTYNQLNGWDQDHQIKALPAMRKTCEVLLKKNDSTEMITRGDGDGKASDWKPFCRELKHHHFKTSAEYRRFIEDHLKPYQVGVDGETQGTFTGYYEPILVGSKRRHGPYQTPLYRMPSSKIKYKVPRSKIVAGALKGKNLELVWVSDPIDAFFIQVQGSGRVRLDNGHEMRLGYAGQNGYPYFAIGKALIDRGELQASEVNMNSIKRWLRQHPRQAEKLMSMNQSYVFFKETRGPGPIGSHGVPLTPHRSMAVDRSYISLGTPVWLDASHPDAGAPKLRQMMIAQDTGGAIKGAVRGDYFWGSGDRAGDYAGLMNSQGKLYVLLPK